MASELSDRLRRVVDALPLHPGMRVLEIGGAPGSAAREVAARVGPHGHVLVLDRSETGIRLTRANCREEIDSGLLSTMCAAVEDFELEPGTPPFDLAFACRVGALDGRHARLYAPAVANIRQALIPNGKLYVDTGSPLTEIPLG
ncbi:SAM-dependent methyltransferase [Agromyces cerinus]|uniref:SAM-dependent methyltransferase n=1 Tax=Agromyces cerinus TaxID=33878 RepID=UPI00195EF7ED|nr:methyltransferase domain-containing protein [Agromyces cerinus]MBM7832487.1 SAM-dependent methyltransferase [Agromyces cerinus]